MCHMATNSANNVIPSYCQNGTYRKIDTCKIPYTSACSVSIKKET